MEIYKSLDIIFDNKERFEIQIRGINPDDKNPLIDFFNSILKEDLIHFYDNICEKGFADRILNKDLSREQYFIVATLEDSFVGICSLTRELNTRSSHVGELWFYILPEYRHHGIGLAMVDELYFKASNIGVEKLCVKIPESSVSIFQKHMDKLGFEKEGVFKDQIKDPTGNKQDLVVFGLSLANLWDLMHDWQSPYGRAMEY